jgi:enhancing lycopene biosynthesis protein 2
MKKIAFRISEGLNSHPALDFIQKYLSGFNIQYQIFQITQTMSHESFQGYVAFVNEPDLPTLNQDVEYFQSASKPIVTFNESTKHIAKFFKKLSPVIAVEINDPEIPSLNKVGIETELCPDDDFITDRHTKIISSSLKLSGHLFDSKKQNGIKNLCKELVEMC